MSRKDSDQDGNTERAGRVLGQQKQRVLFAPPGTLGPRKRVGTIVGMEAGLGGDLDAIYHIETEDNGLFKLPGDSILAPVEVHR